MKNKMKYIKNIFSLSLVLMLNSSCKKDLLTPLPQTTVPDVTAFDTPERILNETRGLYSALKNGNFYGGRYQVWGEVRAENYLNLTTNVVTGFDVWNLNALGTSTNSVRNLWSQGFYTINLCNLFVEGMYGKGNTVVGTTLGNQYIGEAYLVRALSYYSLLQLYARPFADGAGSKLGLPLRLTGIKSNGSSAMARNTVAEVYTQIIKDLDSAEIKLPLTYGAAANELNTTRSHRNTAIALKTRVYLSMGNYPAVITQANKIVAQSVAPFSATSGVPHALQPSITNIFGAAPVYNTTESIFSLPMTSTAGDFPGTQNQLGFYFVRNGTALGSAEYSLNLAAGSIWANAGWSATDIRRTALTFLNSSNGRRFMSKYQNPSPYLDYAPVIRYAEVLLNLAEALARTNPLVDARALNLVNAVHLRSDATPIVAATQTQLINAIMLERQIELLGEGLRNGDIMRLLQDIPAKGSVPLKTPSESGYIWPISADELALNPLMVDN